MSTALERACGAVDRLSEACARMGGFLTMLMMLSVVLDAGLRSFANIALVGVAELNAFMLVAMIFVGLAGTQRSRANFRVSMLADHLGPALPGLLLLVQLGVVGVLTWFCWNSLAFSIQTEEVTYGMVQFPVWPARAVLVFGLALLLVQSVADLARFLLRGAHPFEAPAVRDPDHDLR